MTRLSPDEKCSMCGSLLYPPQLASTMKVPTTADYVCLNCGRIYKWGGNPPTLKVLAPVVAEDDDEDNDHT